MSSLETAKGTKRGLPAMNVCLWEVTKTEVVDVCSGEPEDFHRYYYYYYYYYCIQT